MRPWLQRKDFQCQQDFDAYMSKMQAELEIRNNTVPRTPSTISPNEGIKPHVAE